MDDFKQFMRRFLILVEKYEISVERENIAAERQWLAMHKLIGYSAELHTPKEPTFMGFIKWVYNELENR